MWRKMVCMMLYGVRSHIASHGRARNEVKSKGMIKIMLKIEVERGRGGGGIQG